METRTAIIGMCSREAHSNLQRHIRSRSTGSMQREYRVVERASSSRPTRPMTTMELLLMAALTMFARVA